MAAPTAPRADRQRRPLALAAVLAAFMLAQLDGTIVAVANPAIGETFDVPVSGLSWLFNGYLLAMAVSIVPSGELGDRLGARRAFLCGVAVFTAASAGCASATSWGLLLTCRVLQGVGGAILLTSCVAVLRRCYPPGALERALGMVAGLAAVAFAGGPLAGGVLVAEFGWRSVFAVNLPVGIVAVLLALAGIPRSGGSGRGPVDVPGAALLAAGLCVLTLGLSTAAEAGWGSPVTLALLAAGLAGCALCCRYEVRHAPAPLVPIPVLRSPGVARASLALCCYAIVLFGLAFGLPLREGVAHDPVAGGLVLLPLCASITVAGPTAGRVAQRWGTRPVLLAGLWTAAAALAGLAVVPGGTAGSTAWLALIGFGLSWVQVGANALLITSLDPARAGLAGALAGLVTQLGGAMGVAVLAAAGTGAGFRGWLTAMLALLVVAACGCARRGTRRRPTWSRVPPARV